MQLFASLSILVGCAALAVSETPFQHELNHALYLAQAPLVQAMFDYQARGYRLFVKELTQTLSTINSLRKAVESVGPATPIEQATKLGEGVKTFVQRMPEKIKSPMPYDLLKGDALLLGQMDMIQNNSESRQGRPEKLKNLVMQIVSEQNILQALPSGQNTNQSIELSNDIAKKFYELEQLVIHEKVPTLEERWGIIELTQKKIDGMKVLPNEIANGLFWTDRLNAYQFFAYSCAQMLPIDTTEKVLSYSKAMKDFYQLFDSLYRFDFEGIGVH